MANDYSTTVLSEIPVDASPEDRISEYFRLYELTRSELADRAGIDNRIRDRRILESAVHLARQVLDSVRREFGPLSPNSVYRSQALERALKKQPETWISESQHTKGQACDIEIPGKSTIDLARWVETSLTFDQLICECYDPAKGANSGWVHVSVKPPGEANRGEVLSYVRDAGTGRFVYVAGLTESIA